MDDFAPTREMVELRNWLPILTNQSWEALDALDDDDLVSLIQQCHTLSVCSQQAAILLCRLAMLKGQGQGQRELSRRLMTYYKKGESGWTKFRCVTGIYGLPRLASFYFAPLLQAGAYRPWILKDVVTLVKEIYRHVDAAKALPMSSWGRFFDGILQNATTPATTRKVIKLAGFLANKPIGVAQGQHVVALLRASHSALGELFKELPALKVILDDDTDSSDSAGE